MKEIQVFDYADKMDEISLEMIESTLKEGYPMIVAWNDWGGHWHRNKSSARNPAHREERSGCQTG